MKGKILDLNPVDGSGLITSDDGGRYSFSSEEFKSNLTPRKGMPVDFECEGDNAKNIYKGVGAMDSLTGDKNKFVAGVLAILFGSFGVHKFYLSRKKQGFIMLGAWLIGWILVSTLIGAVVGGPLLWVLYLIGFVEGIIMLIKPVDQFEQLYVEGNKAWF